jgi:hypothetical protein
VTLIASLEVAEALKILTGNQQAVCRDLRTLDVWTGEMRSVGRMYFGTRVFVRRVGKVVSTTSRERGTRR